MIHPNIQAIVKGHITVFHNGYTVTGESACASTANF